MYVVKYLFTTYILASYLFVEYLQFFKLNEYSRNYFFIVYESICLIFQINNVQICFTKFIIKYPLLGFVSKKTTITFVINKRLKIMSNFVTKVS